MSSPARAATKSCSARVRIGTSTKRRGPISARASLVLASRVASARTSARSARPACASSVSKAFASFARSLSAGFGLPASRSSVTVRASARGRPGRVSIGASRSNFPRWVCTTRAHTASSERPNAGHRPSFASSGRARVAASAPRVMRCQPKLATPSARRATSAAASVLAPTTVTRRSVRPASQAAARRSRSSARGPSKIALAIDPCHTRSAPR